jgi:hypothetical protein
MNRGIDIKSLYTNPAKAANNPIKRRRYLIPKTGANPGAFAFN